MRSLQHVALLLCGVTIALAASGCDLREEVQVLRLSHVLDASHPVHQGMAFMAQRLDEEAGGTMRVEIYPSGQLGNERESVELLQLGMLDMTKVSSSVIENFVPAMGVFSLPYLFRDQAHYRQLFASDLGKEILLQGEPYMVRGLCYYDAGFRSFYTNSQPVHAPADLNGEKIRVMRSNISIRSINILGGSATPLAYGELYTALQQGVVDENNPPNFHQSKHYEVSRYYSLDEHSAPPDVLMISTHRWARLTEQQRAWLMQAVEESVVYQGQLWNEATTAALQAVEAAGVTVIRPDKAPFRQAVEPLYEGMDDEALSLLAEQIRAMPPADTSAADTSAVDAPSPEETAGGPPR